MAEILKDAKFSALEVTGNTEVGGSLTITGDFKVEGTTSSVNTTNTTITDKIIELQSGLDGANEHQSGIIIERGTTGNNAFMGWDETADAFVFGTTAATADSTGDLDITPFPLSGTGMTRATTDAAQDLTFSLTGNTDSSLVISSTGTGADALQITASGGGMNITSASAMDITTSAGASDITIDPHTSGGVNIGSADSELGFFGATAVVKATTGIAEANFAVNDSGSPDTVNVNSTFGGYTLQQIAQALVNYGLL